MSIRTCGEHKKYQAGCEDCRSANRAVGQEYKSTTKGLGFRRPRSLERQLSAEPKVPGPQKPTRAGYQEGGIRSQENWDRFNELGKRLTDQCDT